MAKAVRAQGDKKAPAKEVKVSRILITQPRPETEKSPYFDLAKKFGINLDFHPFILVEGLPARDFRKQKVDITAHTGVVMTSRNSVDHFFRMCEEMKIKISQDMKYFCITEAVALYLQKFILYRKRKVFFSPDGSTKGLQDVITKHKSEKFLVPVTEGAPKSDISLHLEKLKSTYSEVVLYRTVANDLSEVMQKKHPYDMIVFFSPNSVQALIEQQPGFSQNGTLIGAFGPTTSKAVEDAGLRLDVKAPAVNAPSMVAALDLFLGGKK